MTTSGSPTCPECAVFRLATEIVTENGTEDGTENSKENEKKTDNTVILK